MKTNILRPLFMVILLFFCFAIVEINAQTIKKDPVSGIYNIQGIPGLPLKGNKPNLSKFDRKKFDQQVNKLKKVSKLHSTFENIHKSQLQAQRDTILKQKQKLQKMPKLERVKLLGKLTPFYRAPFIKKSENSFSSSHAMVSNVFINGNIHDTVNVGDPFTLTFAFAPNSITAAVNIYIDSDNDGTVSSGDLKLTNGLVMDNSDYDGDPLNGSYKLNFSKDNGYSNFVASLIFEVNDYQSVSYAMLTVKQNPSSSIILGALNVPLKNVLVQIDQSTSYTYVLTDSAGKFSANIDNLSANQVKVWAYDIFGASNGYIPPAAQYLNITTDTTNVYLEYTLAKSFIEGYAKDQFGVPIKNVSVEADGMESNFTAYSQTDSTGYYKLGVGLGTWYMYTSISWTNDYLRNMYSENQFQINQEGIIDRDFLFLKSNSTIAGIISNNGNGIQGLPVYAYYDSVYNYTLTSANGDYSIPVFNPYLSTIYYDVYPSVAPGYYVVYPDYQMIHPPAVNVNFEFKKISGGIEGIITDNKTGEPVANAYITFMGNDYKSVSSDENGHYKASLYDGLYSISVYADYFKNYYQYDVFVNGSIVNLNIALDRTGSFSGTIKDINGNPLYDAYIYATDTLGYTYNYGYPDEQGNYVVSGLSSSNYRACANAYGYILQWYNKANSMDSAAVIPVVDGYNTPDINFVLSKGGSISGKITDKYGNAVPYIEVDAYDSSMFYGSYGITDTSGYYTIKGLNTGKYYVRTYCLQYVNQWYDGAADLDKAKLVQVTINQNTSDINFTLSKGSSVSGVVRDKMNNNLSYASIIILDSLFNTWYYTNSDYSGKYSINQLQPSVKYYVSAYGYGYVQQWYNNVSTPDSATPIILLPEEEKDNISFNLHSGGVISGRVLDDAGMPITYAIVLVEDSLANNYYYGYGDYQGYYTVTNLPSGKYYASVDDYLHAKQWFDHKINRKEADLIRVIEDNTTQNINFDLTKPSSDSVVIKLKLDNIPDTLRFNQPHVKDNYADYWWGVCFDVDGDVNTGTYGYEIEIAVYHGKNPGETEFVSNIIDATYHVLIDWVSGYVLHSNVDVKIDPADKNTLKIVVPKSWAEVNPITSKTKFYAYSYYWSNTGVVRDMTSVGKDMVTIIDPVGDVSVNFVDIVSCGWNLNNIDRILTSESLPSDYRLEQNFPNPFNPSTTIRYTLPNESSVKLIVYNLIGQVVKELVTGIQKPGYHEVNFSASNLASGVYFYSIVANSISNKQDFKDVKKMILIK